MLKKLVVPLTLATLLISLTSLLILVNSKEETWSLFQATSVYAQASQILIEGADSTLSCGLQQSEQLEQQATSASPRILVEYADSILSINLERPTAILPAPSQPPSTTASPGLTSGPTPTQTPVPAPKSTEVSVYLYGQKTEVNVGEDVVLTLSAVNLITKPPMTVQLILKVPSGMSITSTEFIKGGGGQYTSSYDVEAGGFRQIEVHIMTNQSGSFSVTGDICYYFGDDKETAQYQTVSLPVTVKQIVPKTPPTTPANGTESKGLSGTMLAIIIGVSTATVGGVLARVIYGRMRAPVLVRSGVSSGLSPSPKSEQPNSNTKRNHLTPTSQARILEEKVVDIGEGQKGISYESLFAAYIRGAKLITIQDPYIHAPYQIANLREFCEILDTKKGSVKIKLTTSRDEFPESQQENRLNELKMGLLNERIEFNFAFDQTIHDRWIETDTGWRIILGRGLDIFQPGIGFSDQKKRKCKATTITYTRLKTDA